MCICKQRDNRNGSHLFGSLQNKMWEYLEPNQAQENVVVTNYEVDGDECILG